MKEKILFLSMTQIRHLLDLIADRERIGWHFGNRIQFERREKKIRRELERALSEDIKI